VTAYRYPSGPLLGDYARAAAGLVLTAIPPLLLPLSPWVSLPLAVAAGLFVLFAARTAQRHGTVIEMDDNGIHARGPLGGSIPWEHLAKVRLNYYSTRRDRGLGWMQLRLKGTGAGESVRIESTLEGFDEIAERVAEVARRRGIGMTDTTVSNFAALGIDAESEPQGFMTEAYPTSQLSSREALSRDIPGREAPTREAQ
jgi:hypothetical protein